MIKMNIIAGYLGVAILSKVILSNIISLLAYIKSKVFPHLFIKTKLILVKNAPVDIQKDNYMYIDSDNSVQTRSVFDDNGKYAIELGIHKSNIIIHHDIVNIDLTQSYEEIYRNILIHYNDLIMLRLFIRNSLRRKGYSLLRVVNAKKLNTIFYNCLKDEYRNKLIFVIN
jgi:hypothetical protein